MVILQHDEQSSVPLLRKLLRNNHRASLSVVELGAGCGMAGIALAQMRPDCSVFLTDLPEAMEMLQKNVSCAQPAKGSSLSPVLLQWGSQVPAELLASKSDLILISDCTYNADSCTDLVQTLLAFARHSPEVKILVAMKRRNDAEALFEYKMVTSGFQAMESTKLAVPHLSSAADSTTPVVELYLYEHVKEFTT